MFFHRGKVKLGGAVINKKSFGGKLEFEVKWLFTGWVLTVSIG